MKISFVILLTLVFAGQAALADRRNFAWTYQYQTMPARATELELYQTTNLNETDRWEYRIEIEHGLSSRWDFSVYEIFSQPEDGSFKWDAVQFRTRFRIGEEGSYVMDPLVYLEYQRPVESDRANKYELKVILAKTLAPWQVALNPVYELHAGPGSVHEIGLDAGLCHEFSPALSLGLESATRVEFVESEAVTKSYLGPTISFASGEWWYSIGGMLGLSEESDDARLRFLMGIGL